ncbi:MAG TPA: hypothetical protein VNT23_02475, partial [Gaiellaceae bacterium]|nr:hypothetical protein [Gaiellaceae bacterium]
MRGAVLAAVLAVAASGCGGDTATLTERISLPAGETVTVAAAEPAPQLCANEEDGYVVEFPGSWHANAAGPAGGCTFFHPSEFTVPERPESLVVAISVKREHVPFSIAAAFADDAEVADFAVGGRPARRAEYVTSDDTFLPAGIRVYEVVVDLGSSTLIAVTRDLGEGLAFEDS